MTSYDEALRYDTRKEMIESAIDLLTELCRMCDSEEVMELGEIIFALENMRYE